MSEYTSTIEGFQRAMKWSLTGSPQDAKEYVEATAMPTFYHLVNGQRLSYDVYIKGIEEWRGKVSHYEPVVTEFLRDGDMLAALMTGKIKVDGAEVEFESSMFAKLDSTGRMEWLKERSVWGPAGAAPDKGTGLHSGMSAHD